MVPMRAPVAFCIFNRPDTTLQVFERIARARPSLLFVVADAPRPGHAGEPEQCADVNLGCFNRVVSGLDCVSSTPRRPSFWMTAAFLSPRTSASPTNFWSATEKVAAQAHFYVSCPVPRGGHDEHPAV